jgi:colanic acid/amylovoran biosynthesis glycosyltransferase
VTRPLLDQFKPQRLRNMFRKVVLSKHRAFFLSEFFRFRVFASKSRLVDWLVDSHQLSYALNSPVLEDLIKENSKNTLWYFYWGRNPALLIPFLKKTIAANIVCRFHGYDLYKERNNGYIPYQEEVISHTDLLLPCSSDGFTYLQHNFGVVAERLFVARLGTRFQGIAKSCTENRLSIVSCSFCVPVKRLHLIFETLEILKIPFIWTHIGDGPLFNELSERAAKFKRDGKEIRFIGYLPSQSVIPYYLNESFDVFINVSESEGVPVSIMEALSVGLPVIATNVGGTGEIVDNQVGYLVESTISSVELATIIERFSSTSKDKMQQYREAASNKFRSLCDSDQNAGQLFRRMQELV